MIEQKILVKLQYCLESLLDSNFQWILFSDKMCNFDKLVLWPSNPVQLLFCSRTPKSGFLVSVVNMFKRFIQNHFIVRLLSVSLLGYCHPLKSFQFSSTIEFVFYTMIAQAQLFFANDDFVKRFFNKTPVFHRFNGLILKNDSQKAFDP